MALIRMSWKRSQCLYPPSYVLPSRGESPSQAFALYKVHSCIPNAAHSACAPSQLATNKPQSENIIEKGSTESTFPLDRNLFTSSEKSRGRSKPNLYATAQTCQLYNPRWTNSTTLKTSVTARQTCTCSLCASSCGNTNRLWCCQQDMPC